MSPSAPLFSSYISLLTPNPGGTINSYTNIPSRGIGDFVLSSQRDRDGGNIILVTRDTLRSIIFGTAQYFLRNYSDWERQKIYPYGMIDFNVGNWNWGLPKIRFMALDSNEQTNMNPIICLYRMTGGDPSQDAISYP